MQPNYWFGFVVLFWLMAIVFGLTGPGPVYDEQQGKVTVLGAARASVEVGHAAHH